MNKYNLAISYDPYIFFQSWFTKWKWNLVLWKWSEQFLPIENFSKNYHSHLEKQGDLRDCFVLLTLTQLWHVAQWVSRAPPHHTLPAFLYLNGIKIFIFIDLTFGMLLRVSLDALASFESPIPNLIIWLLISSVPWFSAILASAKTSDKWKF